METLWGFFQLLLVYPICVYLFQALVMKIGTTMALKKGWDALMQEFRIILKPVEWLINRSKQHQSLSKERHYGGRQQEA